MIRVFFTASVLFLLLSASEASMSDRTIIGQSLDPRVSQCGVRIDGGAMATLRPFIQASADLSGEVRIALTKASRSGRSTIRQANRFSAGTLGNVVLAVDRPAQVGLRVSVTDGAGQVLCEVNEDFELAGAGAV